MIYSLLIFLFFFSATAIETDPYEVRKAESLLEALNKKIKEEQIKKLCSLSPYSSKTELDQLLTHRKLLSYLLQEQKLHLLSLPHIQDMTVITVIFDTLDTSFEIAAHPTLGPLAQYLVDKKNNHPNVSSTLYLHFHLYGDKELFAQAVLSKLNTIKPLPPKLIQLKEGLEAQLGAPQKEKVA